MNTLMILPLAALVLAVSAYAYLAKRQPEYPNARVIAVFTLLGGSVGGVLLALAFWWLGDKSRSYLDADALLSLLYMSVLLGGGLGCLPASVCGVLLAKKRLTRTRANVLAAAGYGALFGAAAGMVAYTVLLIPFVVLWLALAGGLSAAILSAIVLPKAR
jgi:membrane protein